MTDKMSREELTQLQTDAYTEMNSFLNNLPTKSTKKQRITLLKTAFYLQDTRLRIAHAVIVNLLKQQGTTYGEVLEQDIASALNSKTMCDIFPDDGKYIVEAIPGLGDSVSKEYVGEESVIVKP